MTGSGPSLDDWLALLPEPALVVKATGEIVASNAAFARITGSTGRGRALGDLVFSDQTALGEQLDLWARNKQPVTGALRLRTANGEFDAGVHAGRLSGLNADAQVPLLLLRLTPQHKLTEPFRTLTEQVDALTREVSARKRAEQQLLALKDSLEERVAGRTAQLRELAARLIEAEEAERRRLAHSLHDNLQQLLVTARLKTDMLEAVTRDHAVLDVSGGLREVLQDAIEASRSLTLELSPPILHDAGLCAALAWLARRTREQYGVDVQVSADERAEPDDDQTRIALFMAARELLFNIVKHAEVRSATVDLCPTDGGRVLLRVRDEGRGFDLTDFEVRRRGDGFGLFSLRERADFLGGEMRIDTAPEKGTTVEILVPRGAQPLSGVSAAASRTGLVTGAATAARPEKRIRVLLADDHQILREGIAGILAGHPGTEVVAQAATGQEAVDLARQHRPDVVVMDVTMPRVSGIEATRMIKADMPHVAVVGLSMHDSPEVAEQMIAAGAASCLRKDGGAENLIDAIRQAAAEL